MAGAQARATGLEAYRRNRDGVEKYKAKSYYQAHQEFLRGLEDDPLNFALHMNMGLTFEANEEWAKAEQVYKGVLGMLPGDAPRRFEVLFNLANVQAKNKKIDEALANYQAALEIQPDSQEVKTNIELLWQGGGGEGEGESKDQQGQDQKESKDGQGKPEEKDKGQSPQQPKKQQPKPFNSENLTPQDVKKILDEIKNQEQGIRAQEYNKGAKEAPRGKDW